jgi:type IV secretion system protein TrbB
MLAMTEETQLSARDEQACRLAETLRRQLGPKLCGLMEASDVVELMLNADGQVWVDRLGQGMSPIGSMPCPTAESLIATVASTIRSNVTRENPILECELPLVHPFNGAGFEAVIPPVVSPGPVFTIRRKASAVFTLDEYVSAAVMSESQCTAIKRAVRDRKNILVVGGTGTGKTTLTNAILDHMAKVDASHRLVVIEDTAELRCRSDNKVILRTTDLVGNGGDLMRRWTNDRFLVTPHRVINRSGQERYAIPFITDSSYAWRMVCVPTCQGPHNPPRYKPITYPEYTILLR